MLHVIFLVVAIVGVVIVFGCKRSKDRPRTVTWLWFLIIACTLCVSISQIYWISGLKEGWEQLSWQTWIAALILEQLFHWVFALEYLKAALYLPIILDIFSPKTEWRLKRAKLIIYSAGTFFYCALVAWLVWLELSDLEINYVP